MAGPLGTILATLPWQQIKRKQFFFMSKTVLSNQVFNPRYQRRAIVDRRLVIVSINMQHIEQSIDPQ